MVLSYFFRNSTFKELFLEIWLSSCKPRDKQIAGSCDFLRKSWLQKKANTNLFRCSHFLLFLIQGIIYWSRGFWGMTFLWARVGKFWWIVIFETLVHNIIITTERWLLLIDLKSSFVISKYIIIVVCNLPESQFFTYKVTYFSIHMEAWNWPNLSILYTDPSTTWLTNFEHQHYTSIKSRWEPPPLPPAFLKLCFQFWYISFLNGLIWFPKVLGFFRCHNMFCTGKCLKADSCKMLFINNFPWEIICLIQLHVLSLVFIEESRIVKNSFCLFITDFMFDIHL